MIKRNNGVDLFRLIAAFFIMLVHTNYCNLNNTIVENIRISARWALPYFFICSGYFLYKNIKNKRCIEFIDIEKSILKLISILIICSSIYFTFDILIKNSHLISIETILIGTYFHLWFIGSLIFGYIFIWYIFKIEKEKFLIIISLFILIFAVFSGSYRNFINIDTSFAFFRFLISIPLLFIGMQVAKCSINRRYFMLVLLSLIAGFYLQFIEVDFLYLNFKVNRFEHEILVGTIISSVAIFLMTSILTIPDNRFSSWGKNYSLFIYLYHPLVLIFIEIILNRIDSTICNQLVTFKPIIGFIFSLVLAIILNNYLKPIFQILNGNFHTITRNNISSKIEL
jgi:peptidoglycan/LPS O-acetylase OafA/YrhL